MIITGDAKLVAGALVKARGAMNATVSKDGKGNYGKYATLAAIVEATAAPFAQHGLAIIQEASIDEGGVTIDTWLIHESGGTIEFEALTMPLTDRKPQTVGSAITYARRYQLASVCGLAPDDDDGQAAQDATKPTQKSKPSAHNAPETTQKAQDAPEDKLAALRLKRLHVEMSDLEFNQEKRELALLDAEIAKLEQRPSVPATDDSNAPDDVEAELLDSWKTPADAHAWAVAIGACENIFEAQNSFKNLVAGHFGGKCTKSNLASVLLAYMRKQEAKLEELFNQEQAEPEKEAA